MATKLRFVSALFFSILLFQLGVVKSTTFTLLNKCAYTVWPGILSNAGIPEIATTGFALRNGESQTITPPPSWGGRLWARTLCATDASTGTFSCRTGDCGSGKVECAGGNAATPATLVEFTLGDRSGLDFYDVSLVDGYNLPTLVVPRGGTGLNCNTTGCAADLNGACPAELRVLSADGGVGVACKSACDAFGEAQYCCSGEYGNPDTCKPSRYSEVFKRACPRAYSYAYDDKTSTFVCGGSPDYTITFCPLSPSSEKAASSGDQSPPSSTQLPYPLNSSMVYEGALEMSSATSILNGSGIFKLLTLFWSLYSMLHRHRTTTTTDSCK